MPLCLLDSPAQSLFVPKIVNKHLLQQRVRLLLPNLSLVLASLAPELLTFNLSCPSLKSNFCLASSLYIAISPTVDDTVAHAAYLEHDYKPRVPLRISFDVRQVQPGLQGLTTPRLLC